MLFTELPLKKSKHIPYSNKLPSQFVTNTPYVSPLKICRTVVRLVETHSVIKAKCKHLPTITSYVSPLKICRTVVRQILYYGVRVPTTRNNKNSEVDIYLLRYFGTLEGTLVETHSVFKQFCRAKL